MTETKKLVTFDEELFYDIETSWAWLLQILQHNNIYSELFFDSVKKIMTKSSMKINTLWLKSKSNAGKSLICNSIGRSCRFYVTLNEFDDKTQFPLNDAPLQCVLFINEPEVSARRVELLKNGMEGQENAINVKNEKGVILPRVPWLIASNHDIWEYCPEEKTALLNRCYPFDLSLLTRAVPCGQS